VTRKIHFNQQREKIGKDVNSNQVTSQQIRKEGKEKGGNFSEQAQQNALRIVLIFLSVLHAPTDVSQARGCNLPFLFLHLQMKFMLLH
jgi:hypothetical protein